MKKRIPGALSLLGLICAYLIIRYPLLFLHGMKEWPFDLLVFGVLIIAVSGLILCKKFLPVFTLAGYVVGFALGYLFQFDYGRELNSMWIIWTCVYLAAVLAGGVTEFFCRKRKTGA